MLDAPLRSAALTVLRTFGTTVQLRTVNARPYDVTTGTMTPQVRDTSVPARLSEYTNRELQGTVKIGDRKVEIAAASLATAPTVQDRMVIAGLAHDIIRVQTEYATDEAALYVLQVRR